MNVHNDLDSDYISGKNLCQPVYVRRCLIKLLLSQYNLLKISQAGQISAAYVQRWLFQLFLSKNHLSQTSKK